MAFLCLSPLVVQSAYAQDSAGGNPWQRLERLRESLVADSPLAAEFEQTYTPAGFSSGDTESGRLSLELPACARWDYGEPFPRSYLLCDDVAYSWNEGETSGRRFEISPAERAGLDLLRLDVTELRERFVAHTDGSPESQSIRLEPLNDTSRISTASLDLSNDGSRLVALSFVDDDGNTTLFSLAGYGQPVGEELFTPPAEIEWLDH